MGEIKPAGCSRLVFRPFRAVLYAHIHGSGGCPRLGTFRPFRAVLYAHIHRCRARVVGLSQHHFLSIDDINATLERVEVGAQIAAVNRENAVDGDR